MKGRRSDRIKTHPSPINDNLSDSSEENIFPANRNTRERRRSKSPEQAPLTNLQMPRTNLQMPRTNLQIRLKVPLERVKLPKDMDPEPVCPICLKIIIGDLDDINEHVDECIGPSSSSTPSGTTTPSIIEIPSTSNSSLVNVDGEDLAYGSGFQYTEADIERVTKAPSLKKSSEKEEALIDAQHSLMLQSILTTRPPPSDDFSLLQSAIKSLLDQIAAAPKCAVCWETIGMPAAISVNCWHVCCETCWLKTLGTKRLCPHCSTITNPSDLRKVFF